jgi:hypothetical protein
MKKMCGDAQLEEARSYASRGRQLCIAGSKHHKLNLSADFGIKKYAIL